MSCDNIIFKDAQYNIWQKGKYAINDPVIKLINTQNGQHGKTEGENGHLGPGKIEV